MNVPSSISNSSVSTELQRAPRLRYGAILLSASILVVTFIGAMELRLAAKGYIPATTDSPQLWSEQRRLANHHGENALALIGASRVLLDIDLAALESATKLKPVQLAIDGSSFLPILENLASDISFTGHVLIGYQDHVISGGGAKTAPNNYLKSYLDSQKQHYKLDERIENSISQWLRKHLRSYANGTRPLTALTVRVLMPDSAPQYLQMRPNREIVADYGKVDMPDFYYMRVMRNVGMKELPTNVKTYADWENSLRQAIRAKNPAEQQPFKAGLLKFEELIDKIRSRGGKIWLVNFPTSGMVRQLNEQVYPRTKFWDQITESSGLRKIHFADYNSLNSFNCPDGSHLDQQDRVAFTVALGEVIANNQTERRN